MSEDFYIFPNQNSFTASGSNQQTFLFVLSRETAWVYQRTRQWLGMVTQLMTDGCEQQLEIQSARSWVASVQYRKGRHQQNHTCRVTLLQPDGTPCWASPLAFSLIGFIRAESPRSLPPSFPRLFSPEPEFLNVYGAKESIPMNQFRQTMKPGGPVR